jgi:hypothetical protein
MGNCISTRNRCEFGSGTPLFDSTFEVGSLECSNVCNEAERNCFAPNGTLCTSDNLTCTQGTTDNSAHESVTSSTDVCNGMGQCEHIPIIV